MPDRCYVYVNGESKSLSGRYIYVDSKDYKSLKPHLAHIELKIYRLREKTNTLLDEIKEITLSEERNRETITKLKASYREIMVKYQEHKNEYELHLPTCLHDYYKMLYYIQLK